MVRVGVVGVCGGVLVEVRRAEDAVEEALLEFARGIAGGCSG